MFDAMVFRDMLMKLPLVRKSGLAEGARISRPGWRSGISDPLGSLVKRLKSVFAYPSECRHTPAPSVRPKHCPLRGTIRNCAYTMPIGTDGDRGLHERLAWRPPSEGLDDRSAGFAPNHAARIRLREGIKEGENNRALFFALDHEIAQHGSDHFGNAPALEVVDRGQWWNRPRVQAVGEFTWVKSGRGLVKTRRGGVRKRMPHQTRFQS